MNWNNLSNNLFIIALGLVLIIASFFAGKFLVQQRLERSDKLILEAVYILGFFLLASFLIASLIIHDDNKTHFYTVFSMVLIPALIGSAIQFEKELKERK